jgi:EpsI family protein
MKPIIKNFVLVTLMVAASGLAIAMRPTQKIADMGPPVKLETMIPKAFGEWREEPQNQMLIVDPQQKEMIERIYTETLSRTYINTNGYRVMLSIAYGADQSEATQLHNPTVCYPAQGFMLQKKERGSIQISDLTIPVARMTTQLGSRHEPVTYWITVGDKAVLGGVEKKLAEMRYGLVGQIPDGLLFRVSSIDTDDQRAFKSQAEFVVQLLGASTENTRMKLAGSTQSK